MGSIPTAAQPLEVLAHDIAANCKVLSDYLVGAGLPQPSFASDGPTSVLPPSAPKETQQAKADIAEAAFKLHSLVTGPSELIPNITAGVSYYPVLFSHKNSTDSCSIKQPLH